MSIMRVGGVWCWLLALPAPTSVIMALGGDPPRDPLAPPLSVKPLSLAPSSASPLRHSRGLHGNPVLECVRLSSPSVILGPCPGIQSWSVLHFLTPSFSWPPRESSPRPHSGFPPAGENDGEKGSDKNRTGFPPSVRMTEGKGGRWSFPRLFSFRRHSRALPRESSPGVCCIFLRRHSRGLHGNPVLDRILDSRLLARMTEGEGGEGQFKWGRVSRLTDGTGLDSHLR